MPLTPRPTQLRLTAALALLVACSSADLAGNKSDTTSSTTSSGSNHTVPGSPSVVSVSAGNASATVTFSAPSSDGGSAITGYTAICTPSGGTAKSQSGTSSPITVTGLTNGTSYSCAVTAINAVGTSVASQPMSVTPATVPDAPTQVNATAGDALVNVMFTAPANNGGAAITGYTASCTASPSAKTAKGTASPITVTGLTNGTATTCTVTATNSIGTSVASTGVTVTPAAAGSAPSAPQNVAATAGNASATITFTAPASNGSSAITSYIASCTASGVTKTGSSNTVSAITVSGLTNGTTYSCSVATQNATGSSPASTPVSVTPVTTPGAPTGVTAAAGNGQATVAFTAPSSTGGATITGYTVTCSATGAATKTGPGTSSPIIVTGLTNGTNYSCTVTATNSVGTGAASSAATVTPTSISGSTSTSGVACSYSVSGTSTGTYTLMGSGTTSFSKPYSATWSCSSSSRNLSGNGIPDHTSSGGSWATAIGVQSVSHTFSLTPAVAASDSTIVRGIMAYALNSVKFDPATDGTCASSATGTGNNQGCVQINGTDPWYIEAIGGAFNFGTDSSNAHTQPDGSYHYHGMPVKELAVIGASTTKMALVGWALDGFPIYARYGYDTATSVTSTIRVITPSYQLKTTPDANRPSTSIFKMGTFTQDYSYVAGSGDLDECNGRFGVTPDFPNGIYHYYITDKYPYVQRCWKGTPK